ncbi:hypothetical protein F7725_021841 [Dissostichus mawsoni]|uniref:CCR4-NOT transcription complex subunit 4 n=1 Tax=Dissostichus mawsoni TaxID=36200 RepID=A0A7J5ZCD0_DISMA|nr:hypothetical protein F7725_021841 [Dissostichus mawsoni]
MSTQSTNVAFLIGTIAILSLITTDCVAVKEDEKGFILCVTSRRGMQDHSYQNLTNVPSNLPDDTQYLDISHNSIRRLSGASFFGLSQLCCLKVTHCGLQEISPSVFSHTPALNVLNISFNDLPIVPDISLKQMKILDLAYNLYKSYRIPASFQNLTNLDVLSLGSPTALSVNYNDFDPLSNVSLSHLVLGAGIRWQKYDSGALAKLKSLKTISVFASFCGEAINITYNEDRPGGFQFRTINHSVNLCSITFNGVKHYQYKYPQINMSLEAFSNLTYLKFSGTGMNILPCKLLSVLPSLETLDLSDNLLKDTGFWWFYCSTTSVFPKLRRLYLSKNRFSSLSFISEKTNQMKTLESLDLSFNSISLDGDCSWPAQLIELSLANNNLGNNKIDLSKTGITAITQKDLSRFHKLTHLQLSSNSIQVIPADLSAPSLLNLYVDQNAITSISKLAGLSKLQTLKAGNNPFVCSCDSYWFVSVLNKSLLADWPLDYTCSTPPSFAGVSLSEYKTSELSCEMWLQAAVAVPVLIIISAAIGLVFYKCDGVWYTKMLWVWIRVKRRGKKNSNMLKNLSFQYHAFISYSHQDSGWVDSRLVRSLEGSGFSLCVHERDFVPGDWIIDNIINCVESSYKTLFILSKHFVQSEWCNYELFFAQHRAVNIQQDSLVFILLEPIPTDSLPKKFLRLRSLLRQQTYLEWPNDERKQQVFWASLKSMLRVADKSMLLKDRAATESRGRKLAVTDLPTHTGILLPHILDRNLQKHIGRASGSCPVKAVGPVVRNPRMSRHPCGKDDMMECPLCMEPLEIDDVNFFPCTCGYQICRFCWHRIRTDENGLCPACRKPYPEDPAVYKPLSQEELQRIKNEKKQKQTEKKQKITENRKHLASVRVVQRNLVFVVGLSQRLADPEVLKRLEYFGKFGKIHKVVINNSTSYAGSQGPSASAYVTYLRSEDALRAIQCVNNVVVDSRTLKASLGTTKYCSYFLKSMQCPKPDCMYLHELGDEAASFTKEEMQAGKHQEYEQKLLQDLSKNNPTFLQTPAVPGDKPKARPTLYRDGRMTNGLSSEHRRSPTLDGSDSEHLSPEGPEPDLSPDPVPALCPFSSHHELASPRNKLTDISIGNGETSQLLHSSDSPSPPPGLSKPGLMVPLSVTGHTPRSPFEAAAAESQSLFSDNSNFRHPNPLPSGMSGFPTPPHSNAERRLASARPNSSRRTTLASTPSTSRAGLWLTSSRRSSPWRTASAPPTQNPRPPLHRGPFPNPLPHPHHFPHHQHPHRGGYTTFGFPTSSSSSSSSSSSASCGSWMGPASSRRNFVPLNHTNMFLVVCWFPMSLLSPCVRAESSSCAESINVKQWQDGLRALLPNININFGGQPNSSSSSSSSSSSLSSVNHTGPPGLFNSVPHSRSWESPPRWMDPAIITGLPPGNSVDSLQDDNPPHWLKSLQTLTENDAPPPSSASHNGSYGGQPPPHRASWAHFSTPSTHFHSPPPGFQTAFRPPLRRRRTCYRVPISTAIRDPTQIT